VSANLEDLAASITRASEAIEAAQGSCGVTRDRGDGATLILAGTADGSTNDLLADALAQLGIADTLIESALTAYVLAAQKVEEYRAQKGLGIR
jgi:hypothetical protein